MEVSARGFTSIQGISDAVHVNPEDKDQFPACSALHHRHRRLQALRQTPQPAPSAAVAQSRGMATAIIAFADPLRQAAAAAYGINAAEFRRATLKDKVVEAWGITRRQMLINLGETMRGIDPDHWVKAASSGYKGAVAGRRRSPGKTRLRSGPPKVQIVLTPTYARSTKRRRFTCRRHQRPLRRDGVTWDGISTKALAHVAQHRDDALGRADRREVPGGQRDLHRVECAPYFRLRRATIRYPPDRPNPERRTAQRAKRPGSGDPSDRAARS